MANNKTINSRVQHKIDTSENWAKAENFIPLQGELIIYSDVNRIKVGDGVTNVNNLSFTDQELRDEIASFDSVTAFENNGIITLGTAPLSMT